MPIPEGAIASPDIDDPFASVPKTAAAPAPAAQPVDPFAALAKPPAQTAPVADPFAAIGKSQPTPIVPAPAPKPAPVEDSTWDKIKAFATHPLLESLGSLVGPRTEGAAILATKVSSPFFISNVLGTKAQQYLHENDHKTLEKISSIFTGGQKAVSETAEGMSSPLNLGIMAATGGLGAIENVGAETAARLGLSKEAVAIAAKYAPMVQRLVNAGFSFTSLKNAYDTAPEIKKAFDTGNTEETARLLTQTAGSVGLGLTAGLHALGKVIVPVEGEKPQAVKIVDNDAAKLQEAKVAKPPVVEPEVKGKAPAKEVPLRVFHGTSADIVDVSQLKPEDFGKPGTLGIGAYFSTEPKVSGQYAGPADVPTGGRVIAGEIAPGTKLLDADANLEKAILKDFPQTARPGFQKTLEEKFGEGSNTYRGFLESTIGDKEGVRELQKAVADQGYAGVRAEDVHGSPGVMLFGESITGKPLKEILKPTLPTATIVPDDYVPTVTRDAILSEATHRILNNSVALRDVIDPAKLQTGADINQALKNAATLIENKMDPRVGTRISLDAQRQLAADLGMPVAELLNRQSGSAFGAEQALAARAMETASADHILDLAKKAAGGDAEARSQLPLSVARHQEILNQIAGVKSEAGRALGSFRIADEDLPALKIGKVMAQLKGPALDEAAKLLANLDPKDPAYERKANALIREIKPATTANKLFEVYRNFLLSGPATVLKKIASESMLGALELSKKALVGGIERGRSLLTGKEPEAFASEAYWFAKGAAQALSHTGEILRGEFDLADAPGFEHGGTSAIKGVKGKIIRLPSEIIERQTNLVWATQYFGELNALGARQAIQEGLEGQALAARQEYLAHNPSPEMAEAANKFALHGTFQSKLGTFGTKVSSAIQSNPVSRTLFPFFRVPVMIAKTAFEYSPYGVLKGTAVGDLNLQASGLIGSAIAAAIGYMAHEGLVSGGGPISYKARQTKEATGWQAYSLKIGNRWFAYHKAEPLGLVLGTVADAVHGALGDEDPAITKAKAENAAKLIQKQLGDPNTWNHVARNISDLPFLSQISQIVDGLQHLGEGASERIVDNLLASILIPAAGRELAQTLDPTVRAPQRQGLATAPLTGLGQTLEERIPGLTQRVPAAIDVTGAVVKKPISGLGGANPFPWTEDKNKPIVNELARLGVTVENLPAKITVKGYKGKQYEVPGLKPPSQEEAQKLQQQEQSNFFALSSRAIQNPNWKALPDDQKKLVLSALHKKVIADRLRRLQQMRAGQ